MSYFGKEERLNEIARLDTRERLCASEKQLSRNIFQRGVDKKLRLGIKSGALADRLPTLTIAAKNLATEMTNYNVEQKDLQGETAITKEHVDNNAAVRKMLTECGIIPENLPPAEDVKKVERRLASEEKKMLKNKK